MTTIVYNTIEPLQLSLYYTSERRDMSRRHSVHVKPSSDNKNLQFAC